MCYTDSIMQKAKHRTKTVSALAHTQNCNGFHKSNDWILADRTGEDRIANIAGSYKDDPFWDEFIGHLKEFRQAELERDLKSLENEP